MNTSVTELPETGQSFMVERDSQTSQTMNPNHEYNPNADWSLAKPPPLMDIYALVDTVLRRVPQSETTR